VGSGVDKLPISSHKIYSRQNYGFNRQCREDSSPRENCDLLELHAHLSPRRSTPTSSAVAWALAPAMALPDPPQKDHDPQKAFSDLVKSLPPQCPRPAILKFVKKLDVLQEV